MSPKKNKAKGNPAAIIKLDSIVIMPEDTSIYIEPEHAESLDAYIKQTSGGSLVSVAL